MPAIKHFPIVAVGASAGGLDALTRFLRGLPKKTGMAFVLIQHLEPEHKSLLTEILSRETNLNIRQAENNLKVEPAHIYVIPPNASMSISRGRLRITARTKQIDGKYLPIDLFMISLAGDQRRNAVGVILSGTGSDGTLGAKAIKEAGGAVFAQDEKSSKFFGMPGSVIESGLADFVLEPGEIARELQRLGAPGRKKPRAPAARRHGGKEGSLEDILVSLRDATGVDFIHYKQTTVGRRISRRMGFHNIRSYAEYGAFLRKHPEENALLYKDILIPVTTFFRDPGIFAALKKKVFPRLLKNRPPNMPVRLWVPACSTGQEAYSLAIALYEYLEESRNKTRIQVFGTDLSEANIIRAHAGVYSASVSASVPPDKLRRYFVKTENEFKIAKHIRDLCIFARQDLTMDPPLSNMDLASCRNMLIYMDAELQHKALAMLHYSLKPKGFLLLGSAESVSAVPGLFEVVDKQHKLYLKNVMARHSALDISMKTSEYTPYPRRSRAAQASPAPARKQEPPPASAPAKKSFSAAAKINDMKMSPAGLRREIERTRARLAASLREKDAFHEELSAANEEGQSANEELQSMNEELETSKEELQSTNEELQTLNEELQTKNSELTYLNNDLSNFFSSTGIPMIVVGNDLRIKRFTPTARKVMNLIPTDVERPISDIKLNIDLRNLEGMILDVIENMAQREIESKDMEGRWYSVRIRPYRTLDNKIDGAVITMFDIDTIKRSQDDLRAAGDYSESIIGTMTEPFLVLDKDLRVMSANKAFYAEFDAKPAETVGRRVYELGGHQWNISKLRLALEDVLPRNNHFDNFEVPIKFKKAGNRIMLLNGRQIKQAGKGRQLILLSMRDITERKHAGELQLRDKETLERLVRERTAETVDVRLQLEQSKRLSDIGTLAATVAHELRNPLAAITVALSNIKRKDKNPLIEGNLANIEKKVTESARIITNLLFYSKLTTPHREEVGLYGILEECTDIIQAQTQKKVRLERKYARIKKTLLQADPLQLREVFYNVLGNAYDAIAASGGRVRISAAVGENFVKVVIKDNGHGMQAEDVEKAFNPFFTTKAKGTGLGLTVCRHILELHGGRIALESAPGKGAVVTISLPKRTK